MKCDNCGENEANIKYTEIINGKKKEMNLCEKCSDELGINNINFNMSIDFSSFLTDFFDEIPNNNILSEIGKKSNSIHCSSCGLKFEDFMHTGKFGCSNCYNNFESKIDPILKNIHGANRHIGRLGKRTKEDNAQKQNIVKNENLNKKNIANREKEEKILKLKEKLKLAVREEKYEEAAKIRDQIKELE